MRSPYVKQLAGGMLACLMLLATPLAPLNAAGIEAPANWQSDQFRDNPLVGKIWSRASNSFITSDDLLTELKKARYVLLGELHDNADHHSLQAAIISALSEGLAEGQPAPALVIEMIRVDQMRRLNAYLETENPKGEFLGKALQWEQNGWPAWEKYQPIGDAIFKYNLEVYPGHPSRIQINHLIKSDLSILPEQAKEIFRLTEPLGDALNTSLKEEIRIAHCDRLPKHVLQPMTEVQRFRDAWMADVLIQASETDDGKARQAILIAGAGHTRDDRGAPWYLDRREPTRNALTVQFMETDGKATTIAELTGHQEASKIPADFIWVTPSIERGDPCENIPDFGAYNAKPAEEQK